MICKTKGIHTIISWYNKTWTTKVTSPRCALLNVKWLYAHCGGVECCFSRLLLLDYPSQTKYRERKKKKMSQPSVLETSCLPWSVYISLIVWLWGWRVFFSFSFFLFLFAVAVLMSNLNSPAGASLFINAMKNTQSKAIPKHRET